MNKIVCKHKVPLNDYCFDCKVEKYPLVDGRDITEPPLNRRAVRKTDKPKRLHKQLRVFIVVAKEVGAEDWQVYGADRFIAYSNLDAAQKAASEIFISNKKFSLVKAVPAIWRQ